MIEILFNLIISGRLLRGFRFFEKPVRRFSWKYQPVTLFIIANLIRQVEVKAIP